ncbi:MAG: hypothetical protein AAF603_08345, partial [Pseudomonadota bacterium]
ENLLIVRDGGTVEAQNIFINRNGRLTGGGGELIGNLIVNGGTVAPGDSAGTMRVDGDANFNEGQLELEIGDPTESDYLIITGAVFVGTDFVFDIELTSDSISEIVLDDYINAEGGVSFSDSFDLATAVRIMSEAGLFPNGESTMLVRFGNQVASIAAAPIPLPGAIAFMITGLAGMGWVRKKKST